MLLRCFTNTTERKRIRIFLTVAWLYLAVWILLRYIQLNLWGLENEKAFKIINIQRETSGRTKHWCEVLLLSCVTERVSFTGMIFEVSEFQNVFILVFSWGSCLCPIWNVQKNEILHFFSVSLSVQFNGSLYWKGITILSVYEFCCFKQKK